MEEMITTLVSRSLASFTCMKKRMTSRALQVAIVRATTVLNRPRSTSATPGGKECQDNQRAPDQPVKFRRTTML